MPSTQTQTQTDSKSLAAGHPVMAPFLFVALECDRPLGGSMRIDLRGLQSLVIGRGSPRSVERDGTLATVRIPGSYLSSQHARLTRDGDRWLVEDAGSRNGTLVNGSKAARMPLSDGDVIEAGHVFFIFRAALPAQAEPPWDADFPSLLDVIPGVRTVLPDAAVKLAALRRVAESTLPVLLLGESGTGKEVLARAIHTQSGRPGAFVAVNCGALPDTLVESQLFGHMKGAFTGAAKDEPGLVRASDKGTLFLDEIGDLPKTAQAALLRVLQEREVTPVGATRPVKVDLRIVSATHRPLDLMAARGEFRHDLHARLNGATEHLLPLRQRREDLGTLIATLLPRVGEGKEAQVRIDLDAARHILRHPWPLNVRELQQVLARAVVLAGDGAIKSVHLPEAMLREQPMGAPSVENAEVTQELSEPDPSAGLSDEELKEKLVALFEEHQGNISAVARAMGKARMQIHRWMKRFNIDPQRPRG